MSAAKNAKLAAKERIRDERLEENYEQDDDVDATKMEIESQDTARPTARRRWTMVPRLVVHKPAESHTKVPQVRVTARRQGVDRAW